MLFRSSVYSSLPSTGRYMLNMKRNATVSSFCISPYFIPFESLPRSHGGPLLALIRQSCIRSRSSPEDSSLSSLPLLFSLTDAHCKSWPLFVFTPFHPYRPLNHTITIGPDSIPLHTYRPLDTAGNQLNPILRSQHTSRSPALRRELSSRMAQRTR